MRGLDGTQTTAVGDVTTQPYFLVYMGFDVPIRMSTQGTISWGGNNWVAADISVSLSSSPSVRIFNEITLFGQVVLTEGTSGRAITIYQGYANDSAHPNPVMVFNGEMGQASISDSVTIQCKRFKPAKTPRHYVVPPLCNHVPADGTRFETPRGVIILERD